MQFLKRNILTLCCLTLLVAMGLCGDAWADGASLMSTAQTKTRNVFDNVKPLPLFWVVSVWSVLPSRPLSVK